MANYCDMTNINLYDVFDDVLRLISDKKYKNMPIPSVGDILEYCGNSNKYKPHMIKILELKPNDKKACGYDFSVLLVWMDAKESIDRYLIFGEDVLLNYKKGDEAKFKHLLYGNRLQYRKVIDVLDHYNPESHDLGDIDEETAAEYTGMLEAIKSRISPFVGKYYRLVADYVDDPEYGYYLKTVGVCQDRYGNPQFHIVGVKELDIFERNRFWYGCDDFFDGKYYKECSEEEFYDALNKTRGILSEIIGEPI